MIRLLFLPIVFCLTTCAALARADQPVLIFAAASLKTALDEVVAREIDPAVTISYAGSSSLARQIAQGAPADIFISANPDWMDVLEADGLIDQASRRDLLSNRLVLIGPAGADPLSLSDPANLTDRLQDGPLAMALVEAVPVGIYGTAALQSLGLWAAVKDHVAQTDNVRAALRLVSSGEAPLGVVYATDAAADPSVTVLAIFPENSHPPILYPVARLAGADRAEVASVLALLTGPKACLIFDQHGFLNLGAPS